MVLLLDEICFANHGTYNPERTSKWTNERTNEPVSRAWHVGSREVRYVNYRPTYVSLSRSRIPHASHPPSRKLPRLPADSSWNGPHRRSRCTQGSRETDESTLRPENAEKHSFCPLSSSLREQGEEDPARPYNTWPSSSSNGLLRFLALKANLIERSVEGPRRQLHASETEIASRDLWSTAQIGRVGTPSRRLSHLIDRDSARNFYQLDKPSDLLLKQEALKRENNSS